MRTIGKEELSNILELHKKWLNNEEGGKRADLSSADLSFASLRFANLNYADLNSANLSFANLSDACLRDANLSGADLSFANLGKADLSFANLSDASLSSASLRGADLRGAIGNMMEVRSIFLDTYPVTFTKDILQIGCEKHPIADWLGFDDNKIKNMDSNALDWRNKYKTILKQLIEMQTYGD